MRALLVFNNINDLIYWRWDHLFVKHVLHLANGQGLISTENPDGTEKEYTGELNPDVVIQIFSPIITSQRIMSCQFGNSYSSVQCRDGTNVVFDEIKTRKPKTGVTLALASYERLSLRDQATLVGTSECISAGSEAMSSTLAALRAATSALPPHTAPSIAAVFVRNKLLTLYSTRGAEDLTPADTMFLGVMCAAVQDKWARKPPITPDSNSSSQSEDEFDEQPYDGEDSGQTLSWTVMIGNGAPHALYLHKLSRNVTMVLAIGLGGNAAGGVASALHALAATTPPLAQRDPDALKLALASLDTAMKKALDGLKKCKSQPESPQRKLQSQWDGVRKRITDFLKEGTGQWANLEGAVSSLAVSLRTTLHLACRGFSPPDLPIGPVALQAHTKLAPLYQFLRVKAIGNFTLGSSPAMSRYVEEFPGLVHFLHIDRCNHRIIAPTLPHYSNMLPRKKIWAMVEKTRGNLQEGHLATMWKDGALHYAHLVWFEDSSGAPLKPRPLSLQALRSLPPPNTLPEDYYQKLKEACFPGGTRNVRCWELLAVHIGLLPAGTALAHARRLAATVCDINAPPHPVNLL